MKKFMAVAIAALLLSGCSLKKEVVEIYKGDPGRDGTSCSVAPELASNESESPMIIGSRISCTDGSYSIVLNGAQGIQGVAGAPGQNGSDGQDAQACQAYRLPFIGSFIKCPGQWPVAIADGKDGKDGKDGDDCSIQRQDSQSRVKITCGHSSTYVYDGAKGDKGDKGNTGAAGSNGTSCTITSAAGGANVKCGNSTVFLANGAPGAAGTNGSNGRDGLNGRDGVNGVDGEDAVQPGLSCNVHNLSNWDGVTNILTVLAASAPVGSFTLANLSVGDSPSVNGFPGMPVALQALVGVEGYALDCNGYLNIKTSGLYNFSMLSDDGVRLSINNQTIINDPGLHAPTTDAASSVELLRGQRAFNVIYYQGPNTQIALQLKYSGPNAAASVVIPATEFTH